jgi:hypothetical protein
MVNVQAQTDALGQEQEQMHKLAGGRKPGLYTGNLLQGRKQDV